MYNKAVKNNPFIINDRIILQPIDNRAENFGLSKRYNEFLNKYDFAVPGWFIFCHEDWEILESIRAKLNGLNPASLYGSFGARLIMQNGVLKRDYVGYISERSKKGNNLQKVGSRYENLTNVDTLDCQVIIVHSSLIDKFHLRFDEELKWDLYIEDFCLSAFTKYKIKSKVLNLEVCHWSPIHSITERPSVIEKYPYINQKYKNYTFAGIVRNIGNDTENIENNPLEIKTLNGANRSRVYQNKIILENDSRFACMNYIDPQKNVLDVGCACGDFAAVLKEKKSAKIWGMEYNQESIDIAKKTKAFEDIYQVDLNNFDSENFQKFYHFFDYIVFADVLEHLYYPQKILQIFKIFLRNSGVFVLSIPNTAHASIKANLLLNDFTYTSSGLLDKRM